MKQASMIGMLVCLAACPKGGMQMSTETSTGGTGGDDGMSLGDRKYWQGEKDYIDRGLKDGEERCGVKFSFEWVDRPTLRAEAEKNNNSPYGICDSIVQEVVSLCREGEDEKSSVKAKIKGFQCGYGKPRTLELENGIVKFMGNNEESNFSDWAKPWLEKHL
jgi:hypothetical protein